VERKFIDGHGSSPGFFDSGPVRRAFVPLPASERVALASYDGPVNVLEMQYLCFPIPLNYIWNSTKMTGTFAQPSARVLQFIAERGGPFNLTSTTDWSKIEFTCEPNMGDLSVCEGQSIGSWSMIFGKADNPTATTLPDEYQGEWVTSTFVNIDNLYPNIRMKYTVCAKHVKSGDGHARIESKSNLTEPVLLNGTKDSGREAKWDTSAIQRVLGVQSMERRSSQQRGIFQLLSHKVIEYGVTGIYGNGLNYVPVWVWCIGPHHTALSVDKYGRSTCGDIDKQLNLALLDIFNNTLIDTGRIGLALEAVTSILHADTYYQNMPRFEKVAAGTIKDFVSGQAPRRWLGFGIVVGFMILHLVLVTSVIIVFVRSRSFDNIWKPDEPMYVALISSKAESQNTVSYAYSRA